MKFTAKEIINIALGIEESGYQFYTRCAEKFNEKKITGLFHTFAGEELIHKSIFQELLHTISDVQRQEMLTEEYSKYLTVFGDDKVFKNKNNLDNFIKKITTPMDAVKYALIAEKDSILYYTELKELYYNDNETLITLNRIIIEERKHITQLLDLRESSNF